MTKKWQNMTKHDTPTDMTEHDTLTDITESEMTCMRMFILMKPLWSPPVLLLLALERFPGLPLLVLQVLFTPSCLIKVTLL